MSKVDFISVQNISAQFENGTGELLVLQGINFSVPEFQFVALIGPSGSGKTTLLRIMAGLLPASSGEVRIDGKALQGSPTEVGMVFQNANLMPWRTVLDNILLPLEMRGLANEAGVQAAKELISLVGLDGFEDNLPRDLSGGMAQRVAIARALVQDPELLLLDEPFGALDAITRERMGEELLQIWSQRCKTVIMVTHDISEALFLADRVLVLSERPGTIKLDLPVSLPRPRQEQMRYTTEFGELAQALRGAIS